jgi:RNA polymerase-interacting CarD/CdnL/TRCF family regulator
MTMDNNTSYDRGDWIVHCHHGVGQIEKVERKAISDQENTYYRVRTNDSIIWIPVDQIDDDQIRPLMDEEDFQEAVEVLKKKPKKMASNLNSRKSRIKQVIVDNVPVETARLIRDLRGRRRAKKGLNQTERRALKNLTKRFVHEWAVCKDMTIEQARQRLNRRLSLKRATSNNQSNNSDSLKNGGQQKKSTLIEDLVKKDKRWAKWMNQKLN